MYKIICSVFSILFHTSLLEKCGDSKIQSFDAGTLLDGDDSPSDSWGSQRRQGTNCISLKHKGCLIHFRTTRVNKPNTSQNENDLYKLHRRKKRKSASTPLQLMSRHQYQLFQMKKSRKKIVRKEFGPHGKRLYLTIHPYDCFPMKGTGTNFISKHTLLDLNEPAAQMLQNPSRKTTWKNYSSKLLLTY